jgi:hypothetical protein
MDPVEINAGAWYLLPIRADEWASDTCYAWSVCEPTTGTPVAEVMFDPTRTVLSSRAQPGHEEAAAAATESVRRFVSAATTPTHWPTSDR